jgi:hypothetical protein
LNTPKGIVIGTLGGQLAATSGTDLFDRESKDKKVFNLPLNLGQWTLLYESGSNRLSIVGAQAVAALLGTNNLPPADSTKSTAKFALIQNMRSVGAGDLDGTSIGSGDLDGTSIGSGDLDGTRSIGSGDLDGTRSIGSGDLDGTSIGSGDLDGTRSIGSGDLDGTRSIGSGDLDGTRSIGSGDLDGTKSIASQENINWYYVDLNVFVVRIRRSGELLIIETLPR